MYVSIDIETLGLDPDSCDTIEFGAVIDDLKTPLDQLPRFHCYLTKDIYQGQAMAMAMHHVILDRIGKRTGGFCYMPPDMLGESFAEWLCEHGYPLVDGVVKDIVVAGKNFAGFDARFLRRIPKFHDHISFSHRTLDPGTLYYRPSMAKPPSLGECLRIAGAEKTVVHTSVEDAIDVIYCLRHVWWGMVEPPATEVA